jgi:hypothetical protein
MITKTDRQLYQQYKGNHDGTMEAFIEWFERGGRSKSSRQSQEKKRVYREAEDVIIELRKNYTAPQIADMIGIGQNLVYQLQARNTKCSIETAKKIANSN